MRFQKLVTLNWMHELLQTGQPVASADEGGAGPAYNRILTHVVAGFEADSGEIALWDESIARNLEIIAATRMDCIGRSLEPSETALGWVTTQRRPLLIVNGVADDAGFRADCAPTARESSMCWPLCIGARVIGALLVRRDGPDAPYTTEDLADGGLMIDLICVAIDNARLHGEQRRRIATLARMSEQVSDANRRFNEANQQLMLAEKMASVGQLAAGVAHEINNPVAFVQGNLAAFGDAAKKLFALIDAYAGVEETLSPADGKRTRIAEALRACDLDFLRADLPALLAESREGVDRVKNIVRHLQDFSNAEPSQSWELADAHDSIDAALELIRPTAGAGIAFVCEYGELPPIRCQPGKLRQIFVNILTNAVQSLEAKGRIVITSQADEGVARFQVSDTGHGIAPEILSRIFDPFFTTRPVGKGTGLGLSMVYRLVLEHGGSIEANSTPGTGTTITMALPLEHPAEKALRPRELSAA